MDLKLSGGDFAVDENGKPETISGAEELFQRAAIRLTVPLGAFACGPALGSRLHTIGASAPLREEKAFSAAQEALQNMPQIAVKGAAYPDGDPLKVRITLECGGEDRELEVKL